MPSWRLTAISSGTGKDGAALLPVPAHDAAAWAGRSPVNGFPGTRRIPAPSPVPETGAGGTEGRKGAAGRVALAMEGPASGGMYQDDTLTPFFTPSLYWISGPQEHSPVSVLSDNQMPVPATDPRLTGSSPGARGTSTKSYGVVMPGPIIGGQLQVANPHVAPKYANRY